MIKRHLQMVVSLLLASGLAACGGGGGGSLPGTPNTVGAQAPASTIHQVRAAASRVASVSDLAIDAGSTAAVANWLADTDYSGAGWIASTKNSIDTSKVTNPAPQAVYQSQRTGTSFTYAIPNLTPSAAYTVRLHFVESWFRAAAQRVFNVTINGTQVLQNFDTYQAAGGANIAIVKEFASAADANGKITVLMAATVNNASVAGIEIVAGSSQASPTPMPSSSPGSAKPLSAYFTGNTPFHHTVADLVKYGAKVLPSTISNNLWAQGVLPERINEQIPVWQVGAGNPSYTFQCPAFGTCGASGMKTYYPPNAVAQCQLAQDNCSFDYHIVSFDPIYNHGEVGGWGGARGQSDCALGHGVAACQWGAFYPFSGSGLSADLPNKYDGADAAGYAWGLMTISPVELTNGVINHALSMVISCNNIPAVYPSVPGITTEAACSGGGNEPSPTVVYGDLVHLKASVNVASLGASKYCQEILQAFQTYGAYPSDTNGGYGFAFNFEYYGDYAAPNPWDAIISSLDNGGDGSGSGQGFSWETCLNRVTNPNDIEVLQINQGGTKALPPLGSS